MHALADGNNVYNLHIAQIRFGGNVALQPRPQRAAQPKADERQHYRKGGERQASQRSPISTERQPGKRRGKQRGGRHVCAATWVNCQVAFARVKSRMGFGRCLPNLRRGQIAEEEKSAGVGMPRHALFRMRVREQVNGGVFERVAAPRFEDEGKVENHRKFRKVKFARAICFRPQ